MFGGFVTQIFANQSFTVAKYSQCLVVLDNATLNKLAQINKEVLSFGIIDQQIVTLDKNGLIEYYLLKDGSKMNSIQLNLKKIRNACFSNNNFIIQDNKRLMCYAVIDNEERLIQDKLECQKDSKIIICHNGLITALSIDQKLYIYEKQLVQTYSHAACITSIALHQRNVAIGDITGKILLTDSTLKQIFRPPQWHAHQVNTLKFGSDGEYLYSAGKEGVVLQWHIHTQRKQFFPRQGNEIVALEIQQDQVIIAIKGSNTIKSIQLQGSQDPLKYCSIQSNETLNNTLQFDNKSVITNGIAGQLQQVDLRQGKFLKQIDILKRNYVSEMDSGKIKDELDINKFQLSTDKLNLCCSVQLKNDKFYISQLKFFQVDVKKQFNCISTFQRPHKHEIKGIESIYSNQWKSNLFVSWSDESIRLWKLATDKKNQQYWTCIYHGCFPDIYGVNLKDDFIQLMTEKAIIILNPINNQIESEINLDFTLNPSGLHTIQNNLAIEAFNNQLFVFNIDSKHQHQITLNVDRVVEIKVHNQYIYLSAIKESTSILMVYDIKSKSVIKANQHNLPIKNIFLFTNKSIVDYYAINSEGMYFHVFSLTDGKQKRSSFVEDVEEEEEIQETQVDQSKYELPQFSNAFTEQLGQNLNSQFERLFYAEQARKLKEFNVSQFFPQQSHLIPSTLVIARRVAQYLSQQEVENAPELQTDINLISQEYDIEETQQTNNQLLNYQDFINLKDQISKLQLK